MPDFVRPLNLKKPVVNRKLIAWVFILTGLVSSAGWLAGRKHVAVPNLASKKESSDSWWGSVKITYTLQPPTPTPLGQEVIASLQSQIATSSGEYGIYVYRLADKVGYGMAADEVFPAASIMKVPIMVATYRKVEDNTIKLEDVQELLRLMGQVSDNAAPVTLTTRIGRPFMRQTVTDLGMNHTDFDQNTTTAYDVAMMWKNLYDGKLISSTHWQQMQEFLTNSIFEDRIPAGVPQDVKVIHKVGTESDVWADSAIVMAPKPLIIVVLNSGVKITEATQLVPALVKTIWQGETAGQ